MCSATVLVTPDRHGIVRHTGPHRFPWIDALTQKVRRDDPRHAIVAIYAAIKTARTRFLTLGIPGYAHTAPIYAGMAVNSWRLDRGFLDALAETIATGPGAGRRKL